ncbi:MAG: 4Fe-4S dicluster domain-containing protein [Muribaculaceae bacterium]
MIIKKIRIAISLILFSLLTLLFLNISDEYRWLFSFLGNVQFFPVVLSFSFGIFSFWLVVTLLFGRAYCSSMCPMGTLQDMFSWLNKIVKRRRGEKVFYNYSNSKNIFRYSILGGCVISMLCGLIIIPSLLDPYSAYGRIINTFVSPLCTFATGKIVLPTLLGFFVSFITLIVIGWISYSRGRTICNTICPIGSTLSVISRHSVWQIEIDPDMCVHCGRCVANCKASCINLPSYAIDMSRCVLCFNCIAACHDGAIHYTASRKRLSTPLMQSIEDAPAVTTMNIDRRKFISTIGLIAGSATVISASKRVTNASAKLQGLEPIRRIYAVTPPGTASREDFHENCIACMLCVSNCPSKVLKASTTEYGIFNALQPVMSYEASYCLYNCTRCTQLCPTKALSPLTLEEKQEIQIGIAQYIEQNCIVVRYSRECGKCAKNCPTGAIEMIAHSNGHKVPKVHVDNCIGCGACENACPAQPIKAIWVDGV